MSKPSGVRELYQHYLRHIPYTVGDPQTEGLFYSDTVLHMPVLEYYASQCWHCTELGIREGNSTLALIHGCPGEVHTWDIERSRMAVWLIQRRDQIPCRWVFHEGDTGWPYHEEFTDTDFLFIDTAHTYAHVTKELSWYGRKARKYLGFHDIARNACGVRDISGPDPEARGILPAIEEFLAKFPGEYRTVYRTEHNNGMWILERLYKPW